MKKKNSKIHYSEIKKKNLHEVSTDKNGIILENTIFRNKTRDDISTDFTGLATRIKVYTFALKITLRDFKKFWLASKKNIFFIPGAVCYFIELKKQTWMEGGSSKGGDILTPNKKRVSRVYVPCDYPNCERDN